MYISTNVFKQFFRVGGGFIINRVLVRAVGLEMALFLSDLADRDHYYNKKKPSGEGWFFSTKETRGKELGLSDSVMERLMKESISLGFVKTKMAGMPAKQYIYIFYEQIGRAMEAEASLPEDSDTSLPEDSEASLLHKEQNQSKEQSQREISPLEEIKPSIGMKRTVAPKETPKPPASTERTKNYLPIATQLADIINRHKHIQVTSAWIMNWAYHIRLLHEIDRVNPQRIQKVLGEYDSLMDSDPYMPVIESGEALRRKFIRLVAAIDRNKFDSTKHKKETDRKPTQEHFGELSKERGTAYVRRKTIMYTD